MRKGALAVLVGVFVLSFGASSSSAAPKIEQLFPLGGQFFEAKKSQGNKAQVRVRFTCPEYETSGGDLINFSNYYVTFERTGRNFISFSKDAQRQGPGTCFVQHRFPPGDWRWQAHVDRDTISSPKSDFLVESAVPVGPLTLTRGWANRYMRKKLLWEFGGNWSSGFRRQTNCVHRVSRDRFRCSPITWYTGDLTFQGRGRVWLSYTKEAAYWNVAFRIRKTNGYCLSRGGSMSTCSRVVVER